MTSMHQTTRIVRRVGRRLRFLKFAERLQDCAALAFFLVLLVAIGARIFGSQPATVRNLLVGAGAALAAALLAVFSKKPREQRFASEADRILGTEERISTAQAVHDGRADDPLGFLPALDHDAETVARLSEERRIRDSLPVRRRTSLIYAAVFLAAAILVPLVPLPHDDATADDSAQMKKEREKVAAEARKLQRKAREIEKLAAKNKQEELRKLAEKIRGAEAEPGARHGGVGEARARSP
jgi:hypothetical protein